MKAMTYYHIKKLENCSVKVKFFYPNELYSGFLKNNSKNNILQLILDKEHMLYGKQIDIPNNIFDKRFPGAQIEYIEEF